MQTSKPASGPTLSELQTEVMQWQLKSFPHISSEARPPRILGKVVEEVTEFFQATGLSVVEVGEVPGSPAEEAADVLITLLGWAAFSGVDLAAEVEIKLAELARREFEYRDGRYYRKGKEYAAD